MEKKQRSHKASQAALSRDQARALAELLLRGGRVVGENAAPALRG